MNGPIATIGLYHARMAASRTPAGGVPASAVVTADDVDPVFDPDTGEYVDPAEAAVWSGPVLVRPMGSDRTVDFRDGPVNVRVYEVDLIDQSKSSAAVQPEQVLTVSSSQPDVNGLTLRILDVQRAEMSAHVTVLGEAVQHE